MARLDYVPDAPLEPQERPMPECPVCGMECNAYYKDYEGRIIGCDGCVEEVDAWEEKYGEW